MRTRTHFDDTEYHALEPLVFVARIVGLLFGLLYLLLGVRFVLEFVNAASTATFVEFMRRITAPFVAPFQGIVGTTTLYGSYHVVWAILIALVAYMILQAIIGALFRLIARA